MSNLEAKIRLEVRFDLLREVITSYRMRLQEMEVEVVELFAANQLSAISECMREQERISRLIRKLERFILEWETAETTGISHDTKREQMNT
ncbi:hypothetical protein KDJ56_06755 [Brevibacillus composti]|uniref:Uncharacterized protein n=1 Tax=Brevibacillus composti TaxID=2796470 RepID=A0A7T5EN16_9BACL|nr:hypothetical protein [Brevibacillus composti]QQE75639.1 hypothetical protein JD108_07075 [Brevibacillus composti]QUO42665.1 hypothetical protein KDJ56_06755 [Brevibacillus composti]